MKCKICDGTNVRRRGKARCNPNFPRLCQDKYEILQCSQCGFYYLYPELDLTQDEWAKLYEDDYFAGANITRWQQELHKKERQERVKKIKEYYKLPPGKFLDFGCGEGLVLQEALLQGFEPYGLDIADNIHESIDRESVQVIIGNIFEAKFQNNFFSAVYMDSVLEHNEWPMPSLHELYRILKPGGILMVIVPNEDCLVNDLKRILYTLFFKKSLYGRIKPFVVPYHIQGFNRRSLEYALKYVGFNILQLTPFGSTYPFWRAFKPFSKPFFRELFLYPFDLLSVPLQRQMALMAFVTKPVGAQKETTP